MKRKKFPSKRSLSKLPPFAFNGRGLFFTRPFRPAGFTLIEIIIVMAVLGILLAIGVPQASELYDTYRLGGAARIVKSDLHQARMAAIKTSRPVSVTFSNATTYSLLQGGTTLFTRSLTVEYPGVTASMTGSTVEFSPMGTAQDKTVLLQLSGRQKSFTISWSGRIENV